MQNGENTYNGNYKIIYILYIGVCVLIFLLQQAIAL